MAESAEPEPFQRVSVVGTSCSGKTTLARALAQRTDSAHIELDALHWGPAWTPVAAEEFRRRVSAAVAAPRWVCDGNYASIRDLVWARATVIVWLNYPFPLVFSRALRRTVRRVATREELYSGNRESWRQALFSRESILLWVISTHADRRRRYTELLRSPEHAHQRIFELRHPRDAERLVSAR